MRAVRRLATILVLLAAVPTAGNQPAGSVFGTITDTTASASASIQFVGSTPCGEHTRRFLGIGHAGCEQITWELALASEPGARQAFELRAIYHLPVPGAPGHLDAGTPLRLGGTWTTERGAGAHGNAAVYALTADGRTLRFALLEHNLLHLLTADSRLMVGNAGWSYTLNRRAVPTTRDARRMEAVDSIPRDMAGEFEGRTPCQEISSQLNLAADAGCTKLKWGLTLFGNGTYKLEGTLYRAAARTGTWGMLRDGSSGALIYRLDPDQPGGYLSLIRADENVLFFLDKEGNALAGDRSHSYTLNRAARRD